MVDEINIPESDSPINKKIIISSDVETKNAETLLKGYQSNEIFILFVNYLVSPLAKTQTNDMQIIRKKLIPLTIRNTFKEQDKIDYEYSGLLYKKYLQQFVNQIKQSVFYSTEPNGFSLIKPKEGNKNAYQVNTGRGSEEKFEMKNRVSVDVFFKSTSDNLVSKTVNEIINSNVAEYPLRPKEQLEENRGAEGWLLSRFDTNTPLMDTKDFLKTKGKNEKKRQEYLKITASDKEVTVEINTYKYFNKLLQDAGYTGLLNQEDSNFYDQDARTKNEDEHDFYVRYLPRKNAITTKKKDKGLDGLVLRNYFRPVEKDAMGSAVYSTGNFSRRKQYNHTDEDIEQLRQDISATVAGNESFLNSSLLTGTENTSQRIDTLSADRDIKEYIDNLFTPKDRKIEAGIYKIIYTVNKEGNSDKLLKSIKNKRDFNSLITTNTLDSKKRGVRNIKQKYTRYIRDIESLLEDLENNNLKDYVEGRGELPVEFFEELLNELGKEKRKEKGEKIILDSIKDRENLPIDAEDTIDDIEDKLLSEDIENNSIIVEDLTDEANEKVNSLVYNELQSVITNFIDKYKTKLEIYQNESKTETDKNQNKYVTYRILTHEKSTFEKIVILDATRGRRGGISNRPDLTTVKPRIAEAGNKKSDTKTEEVKAGNTISLLKRAMIKLEKAVSSIGV